MPVTRITLFFFLLYYTEQDQSKKSVIISRVAVTDGKLFQHMEYCMNAGCNTFIYYL
jgi:hypothetical protein